VCFRAGTPTDNPFIEAFNSRVWQECLNQHWFLSLDEVRTTLEDWRQDYNAVQPHTALGNLTPAAFQAAWLKQQANEETG
jgi:putative transposase